MNDENILQQILEQYGLAEARAQLLGSLWNRTYRVDARDGQRFSLRICPAVFQNHRALEDELIFLDFVASRNRVRVPCPVRNQRGDLFTVISHSEGARLSCLFEWIEGEKAQKCLTLPVMHEIGRAVANLHQIAKAFAFPAKDNKFRNDYRYELTLIESHQSWIEVHRDELGTKNVTLLYAAIEQLTEAFERIGETPENFGFIHADLHLGNFLVQHGQVSVIDFDQLGRGHYVYDIAVLLVELFNDPEHFRSRWESFMAGYQAVAALPFRTESELNLFMVFVNLNFLDWVYNSPNPAVREEKMRWLPATYSSIRTRLQQE